MKTKIKKHNPKHRCRRKQKQRVEGQTGIHRKGPQSTTEEIKAVRSEQARRTVLSRNGTRLGSIPPVGLGSTEAGRLGVNITMDTPKQEGVGEGHVSFPVGRIHPSPSPREEKTFILAGLCIFLPTCLPACSPLIYPKAKPIIGHLLNSHMQPVVDPPPGESRYQGGSMHYLPLLIAPVFYL